MLNMSEISSSTCSKVIMLNHGRFNNTTVKAISTGIIVSPWRLRGRVRNVLDLTFKQLRNALRV